MRNSIAGKLTLMFIASFLLVFGSAAWVNLKAQERGVTRILQKNGSQVANMVAGATRAAMLENDRARIQQTIDTLARQRGIERIRIVEKGGRVVYSTDSSEIGKKIDQREEQCLKCHISGTPRPDLSELSQARIIQRKDHRILGITQVLNNEQDCSNAACHVHSPTEKVLGVLDVNLSLQPYDFERRKSAWELLISSLIGILVLAAISATAVHRMVHRPVRKLIKETQKLAAGDLSARVPEITSDELGVLARTFNLMARDLEAARRELLEWGKTLEHRVARKTSELKKAQEQILQVEKMASLGKLAAIVAHEINNPLSSVVTYAKILVRRLRNHEVTNECRENLEYLENIASEASRCGEIVSQLLSFARRRGGEFSPTDINQVIEKSLFLVRHKLEINDIESELRLDPQAPVITGDASQLQQALMALLINSAQAIEHGGKITLESIADSDGVVVRITDDGPGMEAEVLKHAFEPFFTTKKDGAGVGLGLSVVYGIVKRHGGRVDIESTPGEGCRFEIYLPRTGPAAGEKEAGS